MHTSKKILFCQQDSILSSLSVVYSGRGEVGTQGSEGGGGGLGGQWRQILGSSLYYKHCIYVYIELKENIHQYIYFVMNIHTSSKTVEKILQNRSGKFAVLYSTELSNVKKNATKF